jgi:hypothetical protein
MALTHSPVSRNLNARVMYLGLEIEDFLLLGILCVFAMLIGQFFFSDLYLFFLPLNWCLMLLVIVLGVPGLMLFKYGKPRGYLADLLNWFAKPHAYSANERDPLITTEYLKDEEGI